MEDLKQLTGLLQQVVDQNTQALALAERIITLSEQEKALDCWVTGIEVEGKLKGLFSDRGIVSLQAIWPTRLNSRRSLNFYCTPMILPRQNRYFRMWNGLI